MMNKKYIYILVCVMLLALAGQAITSMRYKSPACDESSHHIATGYSFLKTGDFRLNSTSPPVTEEIAALGMLPLDPKLPLEHPSWDKIDRLDFGFQFLYRYNDNADQLVFFSRLPMVMLSVLCGLLVFIFARDLYGEKAGLFALFLYSFSPNIIAYSRLNTPDIGATFFILLSIYRFYKFLNKPKFRNIVFAGIALGLAMSSKLSALILVPLFIIIAVYKAIVSKRLRYLWLVLAIFLICAVVIFCTYFGEFKPLLENDIDVGEKIDYFSKAVDKLFPGDNQHIKEKVIEVALNTPIPFATYIMNILAETNMVFAKPYPTYLFGVRSEQGWWYYYIVVFLLKTPIPMLIFLALVALFFKRVKAGNAWGEGVGLVFIFAFACAAFASRVQLSVRYILPIYPLCFIYASKLINLKVKRERIFKAILGLLCIWYLIGTLSAWPDYLPYFNEFAGGAEGGWRHLGDANVDYGQDLPALSDYMEENDIEEVSLLSPSTADPAYYGIRYRKIENVEIGSPEERVYAISAIYIDAFQWAKDMEPTAKISNSIFIYDLRKDELKDE
ncbi:MAG: glycosyltransferase family 39 protein [Candidatus Omnitrophica bacterium]|nr:glycosyltransferase family 39 protein [Candidatus Omnitrophota bacterium]